MANPQTEQTPRERILATAAALGLTMESEFVPFSKSRNAQPREDGKVWRSLNWRVTIKRNGRDVLTTDYSAGEAHCPAYKIKIGGAIYPARKDEMIAWECENGRKATHWAPMGTVSAAGKATLQPDLESVLSSLALDSEVLDYGGFEDWAPEFGYDPDSRKAEATYRACLEIALKLRNGLGETGMQQLREACQDF